MLLLLQGVWWCYGCWEDERIALLKLKAYFNYPNGNAMSSWEKIPYCCYWDYVEYDRLGDWYLNTSFFLPFKELNHLSLEQINILGCVENEGFERLWSLCNLQSLDLTVNKFNNSILLTLSGLSSLKSSTLNNNKLKGIINIQELNNLTSLKELNLQGNEIEGFKSSHELGALTNLEELDLSIRSSNATGLIKLSTLILNNITTNGRSSSLLHNLGAFPFLKTLYLRDNGFKGKILAQVGRVVDSSSLNEDSRQSLGALPSFKQNSVRDTLPPQRCIYELKHLHVLDLRYNDLKATLPWCLANLTSLQPLYLSFDHFTGKMFSLKGLTSIQELEFSGNHFQIPISLSPFFNHTRLKHLLGEDNEVYAELEAHNLIPKLQLETLVLPGLGYGGAFPKFLYYQHKLRVVDLSHNKTKGSFPFWLLDNNTNLEKLSLANNSLSGPLQLPGHSHMASFSMLLILKMPRSGFSGSIPSSLCKISFLQVLQLDGNQFTGSILDNLYKCSYLEILDVSDNHLSCRIPRSMGNMSSLQVLDLSRNNIFGSLPSHFNPSSLVLVYLSYNRLQGSIKNAFYGCSKLITLDLSHNFLTGTIPEWICSLSWLGYLFLNHNNLEGEIPKHFGEIPPEIGALSMIQVLNLSHNCLIGPIPSTFSNLSEIESLDLSCNNLDEKIPPQLTQLNSLAVFSVANNDLFGSTPKRVAQFATFDETISPSPLLRVSSNNAEESGIIDLSVFYVSFVVAYIIILVAIAAVLCIKPYWRRAWFYFIEVSIANCQYFLEDNVYVLFKFRV
ncbi:hypothetical protein P3X46_028391 [Hevea brasiliensis]|uniref:Leucine-rich repeat-containing N-terminal plant-type domain-containing protein n=1 Tax=Hevea brasiliensis TaxID=3981 RepID=A0ABQ9KNY3_HEVBR|nr:hypothetical protein P3X46_028391 [Hevea brasiliensis]